MCECRVALHKDKIECRVALCVNRLLSLYTKTALALHEDKIECRVAALHKNVKMLSGEYSRECILEYTVLDTRCIP